MTNMYQAPTLLELNASLATSIIIAIPGFGFFFSIFWSLLFNFESSTYTHCYVSNYLPTVSAAIGGESIASYVWRICIALNAAPRLLLTVLYFKSNKKRKINQSKLLSTHQPHIADFAAFTNAIENMALVSLTYISSTDNETVHAASFIVFVISSMIYMLTICFFHSAMINETENQIKSLKIKKISCIINILSFFISLYFYFRHNAYCETGVYTLFALFEYFVVISNIVFHGTCKLDFGDYSMAFDSFSNTKTS